MARKRRVLLCCALVLAVAAGPADAGVELRCAPSDTTIAPGDPLRISLVLDEVQSIRTIEAYVSFDPTVVESVAGGPGELFVESGFLLFEGFEEVERGRWHGYVVVLGSGDYVVGPGELYHWDLAGLASGTSPVASAEIGLADGAGVILDDVTLVPGRVTVRESGSGADVPAARDSGLSLWPNPFNPQVTIRSTIPRSGPVRLEVFDPHGRRLACLYEGFAPAGSFERTWNGRDGGGGMQAAGLYLFRLATTDGVAKAKAVLLK